MRPYFTRERFGRPQFLAGTLLLVFLAQAAWLVHLEISSSDSIDGPEAIRIGEGWKQWHGRGIAAAPSLDFSLRPAPPSLSLDSRGFDTEHSPLLYLATSAPLFAWPRDLDRDSAPYWRWLPRLPFLACGVFLGASMWYVARRLCGNKGGFVALTLYCFSPSIIQASAVWHAEPEIASTWGAFGAVFTAIAVAHTLYAPREVVLWNWRRIVLLGVALAIAIGSQFSMVVLIPISLAFLFYVAPVRRRAGFVIWIASCLVALVLLFLIYFFHPRSFAESLRHATLWGATWRGFTVWGVYKQVALQLSRACPAFIILLPVSLVTFALWPRTRFFGNTGPLLLACTFLALGMAHPDLAGAGFLLAAVPFLFVFVSGVLADLMEGSQSPLVSACVYGLVAADAAYTLLKLFEIPRG